RQVRAGPAARVGEEGGRTPGVRAGPWRTRGGPRAGSGRGLRPADRRGRRRSCDAAPHLLGRVLRAGPGARARRASRDGRPPRRALPRAGGRVRHRGGRAAGGARRGAGRGRRPRAADAGPARRLPDGDADGGGTATCGTRPDGASGGHRGGDRFTASGWFCWTCRRGRDARRGGTRGRRSFAPRRGPEVNFRISCRSDTRDGGLVSTGPYVEDLRWL